MSRLSKYRVYDGQSMFYPTETDNEIVSLTIYQEGFWELIRSEKNNPFEFVICNEDGSSKRKQGTLMWFTGLLDKNGKEIYEGDIVKIPAPTMDVLCEVKWDERRAAFEHAYGEVIGNIYENPELLSV